MFKLNSHNLFNRSNIAVMFLCDLVLDGLEVDWSPHLPLMLHVIFLGEWNYLSRHLFS